MLYVPTWLESYVLIVNTLFTESQVNILESKGVGDGAPLSYVTPMMVGTLQGGVAGVYETGFVVVQSLAHGKPDATSYVTGVKKLGLKTSTFDAQSKTITLQTSVKTTSPPGVGSCDSITSS